jgi:hypothetical protein
MPAAWAGHWSPSRFREARAAARAVAPFLLIGLRAAKRGISADDDHGARESGRLSTHRSIDRRADGNPLWPTCLIGL